VRPRASAAGSAERLPALMALRVDLFLDSQAICICGMQ
jgi:hypothetical protein